VIYRRRWIWTLVTLGAALAIALVIFAASVPLRSSTLKRQIIETLAERLDSEVSLDDLSLRFYPRLRAEGKGLLIRHRRRPDLPPLIAVKRFSVDADLIGVLRKRVSHVSLEGLDISIPPDEDGDDKPDDRRDHRLHGSGGAVATIGTAAPKRETGRSLLTRSNVVIDKLDSKNARLIIVPRERNKAAKTWQIHTLEMRSVGIGDAMPYEATLTNAVPPGEIVTKGTFGPWNRGEPGDTPLQGSFTFDKADLSVFKGIGGTLSSRGSFGGSLNYIEVHGETETPDFVIAVGGHPFPLMTKYHTIVDGTNGDTRLERIDAQFLQSSLVAKGAVLDGPPGEHGRTVTLDVVMPKARIEDLMHMAVKTSKPPMTGALQLTTKFLLPPGETDVVERLRLNGNFAMTHAKFTNPEVQGKIIELSRRGRGRQESTVKESIASDFKGQFVLGNGRLNLRQLMFAVPGAQVRLTGNYNLQRETLAFKGNLLMDAKVSETVSGFKSLLLKIADPFFSKKGGGSSVPIKIEGTRNDPKFGLDMGRVFKRGD
jgi:AsmA-like protein